MLLSQLNKHLQKLSNRSCFVLRLFFFSLGVHLIFLLFLFFCIDQNKRINLSGPLPREASIVLMPLIKHTASLGSSFRKQNGNKEVLSAEKKGNNNKNTVVQKIKTQKKQVKPAALKTEKKIKQVQKKPVINKPVKQSNKVKPIPEKSKIAKQPPKKEVEKKVTKEIPENKNKIDDAIDYQGPQNSLVDGASAVDNRQTGTVFIGWQDLQELQLIKQIKHEIAQVWKRPAGLPAALVYKALLYIDHEGKIEIKHEESTHSLALNSMARNFIKQFKFPQAVWGYEIELLL